MAGFDDYLHEDKQQEKFILKEEKQKMLPEQESVHLTDQELIEKFESRIKDTTFEARTRHYFGDSSLMHSKAEQYRKLSKNKDATADYAMAYANKSAKKRRNAAAKAAECFEEAAALQDSEPEDAMGLDLFRHREKVLRLRIEGMENAATAKSQSDEDETYRTLRSRLSCLTILKDQLENIGSGAPENEAESFFRERAKLEKEINGVKNKLRKKIPSAQSRWQKENNINKENLFTEGLDLLNRDTEKYPENARGLFYVIKRDAQGSPIDKVELKKERWNEKLSKAIRENDAATRDAMILESMDRIGNTALPSPDEIKKNGVGHYLKKDNSGILELINYGKYGLDSIEQNESAKDYADRRADLSARFKMAKQMSKIFDREMRGKKYSVDDYKEAYDLYKEAMGRQSDGTETE
ncbi:MAG: hypothetical protein K6E91_10530 [Butyrivibrio sp.]|nr:hypothetical protein [Butyrivibrio sp.]